MADYSSFVAGAALALMGREIMASILSRVSHVRHDSASAPALIYTSISVEIGDGVLFRSSDDSQGLRQIIISGDRSDPSNGIVHKDSPLGMQLLGLAEGQIADYEVPGGHRQIHIISVRKALENIKGPIPKI